MTKNEAKASILAQINQQAAVVLIEQASDLVVENADLKTKLAALEARVTEIIKGRDGPMPV